MGGFTRKRQLRGSEDAQEGIGSAKEGMISFRQSLGDRSGHHDETDFSPSTARSGGEMHARCDASRLRKGGVLGALLP